MWHILRSFLLTLIPVTAFAGAWLQPEGKGLAIAQATYFTGDTFFNTDGELEPQSRFSKYEVQPYAEYGLTDVITVGGTLFLHRVQQSGDGNDGLADTELFARTRLWHNDANIISIQPLIKLPSAYREHGNPRGGSRSIDTELSLLYGHNPAIVSPRDYLDTRLGYRWRSRGLEPQWRGDIALGLQVMEHWQTITAMRGIYTQDTGTAAFSQNGEQDYALLKAEIGLVYTLDEQRSLMLTVADHVAGRNAGDGYGISLGYAEAF